MVECDHAEAVSNRLNTLRNDASWIFTVADFLAGNHSKPVLFDRGGDEVFENIANTARPVK
jgi:hypothetical protein